MALYVKLSDTNVVENVAYVEDAIDAPEDYLEVTTDVIPNINDIFVDGQVVDEDGNVIDVAYRHNGLSEE
jgi:hypothetical protein